MQPLYTLANTRPAYQLNWGLTLFWRDRPLDDAAWLADLQQATEPDGVRVIRCRSTTGEASQFFVSTTPSVSPAELIRSVKGRLQHLVRQKRPRAFQRNYCVRSIGSARRSVVEDYVADQLGHHQMADHRTEERLARYQKVYPEVNLGQASFSSHGEYWYAMHLVMVNRERGSEVREVRLSKLSDTIERAAAKHGHRLSRLALLADHIHLTLGCQIDQSPGNIALGYLNNCAYACGMTAAFQFSYYVGTIGEYDRGAAL